MIARLKVRHAVLATVVALMAGGATAAEIKVLEGVPTAQQWTDALKPQAGNGSLTFRGIVVNRPKSAPAGAAKPAEPASTGQPTAAAVSNQVRFGFDSADLTPETKAVLDTLGDAMNSPDLKALRFEIEGHTDSTGTEAHNDTLSRKRADAVADYLSSARSVDKSRLEVVGRGSTEPLDPQKPDSALNRRVQIVTLSQ